MGVDGTRYRVCVRVRVCMGLSLSDKIALALGISWSGLSLGQNRSHSRYKASRGQHRSRSRYIVVWGGATSLSLSVYRGLGAAPPALYLYMIYIYDIYMCISYTYTDIMCNVTMRYALHDRERQLNKKKK